MYPRCRIERINLGFNILGVASTAPKIIASPRDPVVAISIAADSFIDQVDLAPDGNALESFRVGVGNPWIGHIDRDIRFPYPNARNVDEDDPTVFPVRNGGAGVTLSAAELRSVTLAVYRGGDGGIVPPFFPIRRADVDLSSVFTTNAETRFPAFGRKSWTISLLVLSGAGTGFTYTIRGIDNVLDDSTPPVPEGVGDATDLATGTVDGSSASAAEKQFSYDGDPYDRVQVTLSAEVGACTCVVGFKGQDR